MSRCCVPWRSWLVRSPRARWSPGCSPRLRRRGRGRCGPSAKPGSRPGSGPGRWLARARPGSGREPDPRRHRRHDRDRALREGKGRPHLEEDVWVPSPCRVRRSWRRGRGEPLAILLRTGNAGSNTAAEHIEVTKLALAPSSIRSRHARNPRLRPRPCGQGRGQRLLQRGHWPAGPRRRRRDWCAMCGSTPPLRRNRWLLFCHEAVPVRSRYEGGADAATKDHEVIVGQGRAAARERSGSRVKRGDPHRTIVSPRCAGSAAVCPRGNAAVPFAAQADPARAG